MAAAVLLAPRSVLLGTASVATSLGELRRPLGLFLRLICPSLWLLIMRMIRKRVAFIVRVSAFEPVAALIVPVCVLID